MPPQSLDAILRARADLLIRAFHTEDLPPRAAYGSPAIAANRGYMHKGAWGTLAGHPGGSVQVWRHPTDPHKSAVYAGPAYGPYRKAFMDFLSDVYKRPVTRLPGGLDVDHLLAKSLANASALIRLEAVDMSANRSHGAGPERKAGKSPVIEGRKMRDHSPGGFTWLTLLKLAGVLAPNLRHTTSARERMRLAVAVFTARGWRKQEAEEGIRAVLNLAARR